VDSRYRELQQHFANIYQQPGFSTDPSAVASMSC
jgi:hypothetical protein